MYQKTLRSPFWLYGIAAGIMTIGVMSLCYTLGIHILISYLISINVSTFFMYGYDKMIAGTSLLRVPEWILHGLVIGGGSPAGLMAQKVFRHKTVKGSFQLVYWGIVIIQVVIFVLLMLYYYK
ncbi:MAG: DUF1294 domain-containing protein [Thiomargarita sp.]|nr:DUF1294 domain-containing protein [Thiomargarita sp.]